MEGRRLLSITLQHSPAKKVPFRRRGDTWWELPRIIGHQLGKINTPLYPVSNVPREPSHHKCSDTITTSALLAYFRRMVNMRRLHSNQQPQNAHAYRHRKMSPTWAHSTANNQQRRHAILRYRDEKFIRDMVALRHVAASLSLMVS